MQNPAPAYTIQFVGRLGLLVMQLAVVVVLMLSTVLSLVGGIVASSVGGTFCAKHVNKIMFARVALQAVAIASAFFLMK